MWKPMGVVSLLSLSAGRAGCASSAQEAGAALQFGPILSR